MSAIKSFLRNPRQYLAGVYFSLFKKVFQKNGLSIHIPFELTDVPFRGRFMLNKYEKEEATYLAKYLPQNATVLELGSCLGYVSCLTNKILADKQAQVVLEANPALIEWIRKNKEVNECGFHIENAIISKQKQNEFFIHDLIVGGSTKRKTAKRLEIEGVSIPEIEEKYSLNFDTLIMDIEGGELDLFRSEREDLSKFKLIFYEVHPFANILSEEEALECEGILKEIGFQMVLRDGNFQIWEKLAPRPA
ncbi:FkbM family methyltransferase [Poritiphilus flavus]|uniref:FkbM family methyltransferase n=1 Tax=Poritiphilus flavus TaxID=2697053 RepID=A0A6L9ED79_9FLAO|nr:FkbM family methyltransferase [Poritiphilus flavus]NAS12339.1 FkbM family methyltransferase [Poritiphilus flavus]